MEKECNADRLFTFSIMDLYVDLKDIYSLLVGKSFKTTT